MLIRHRSLLTIALVIAALVPPQLVLADDPTANSDTGSSSNPSGPTSSATPATPDSGVTSSNAQPTPADTTQGTAAAGTGAAPTTDGAKPAGDGVPDFLKQYDNKIAPSIPSTTTSSPGGAAAHTKSPALKDALNQVQAAPKAKIGVLRGRLEEIVGPGAKLPVGLNLGLKAQAGKVDTTIPRLEGLVASFPMDWRGTWGGSIVMQSQQFDPLAWQFDREETDRIRTIQRPGTVGSVSFTFYQNGRTISLQPAQIVFPPRNDSPQSEAARQQLRNSGLGQMLGASGGGMLDMLTASVPVMFLGDMTGQGVSGNLIQNQVVKNDIRQLQPNVLEQNLVTRETERHRVTGQVLSTYSETVLRFTRTNPSQLYVQTASLKYRSDGHFLNKVLMYGTVTRGQATQGLPNMGGFPGMGLPVMPGGGFPGLGQPGQGGMGGFGDLEKMMKQLQGL